MRKIFVLILALLILGGGGAGVYFYFQQPAEASIGETGEHTEAKEARDSHDDHVFVELSPLVLPIIDENGVNQVVSLVIAIEVEGNKEKELVTKLSPRLTDAFIQDMYGILNRHAALKGGVVQVGIIKRRLKLISSDVLGDDLVKDVLLQVVQQRKI